MFGLVTLLQIILISSKGDKLDISLLPATSITTLTGGEWYVPSAAKSTSSKNPPASPHPQLVRQRLFCAATPSFLTSSNGEIDISA